MENLGTPITKDEIRKADKLRFVWDEPGLGRIQEIVVIAPRDTYWYASAARCYLVYRAKKLLYSAGTHLWLTAEHIPWKSGDGIVIKADWYEGESGRVDDPDGPGDWVVGADYVTDVRPTTPVVLPTEPTWGWVYQGNPTRPHFGRFRTDSDGEPGVVIEVDSSGNTLWQRRHITGFTEAVAVPKDVDVAIIPKAALDDLRAYANPERYSTSMGKIIDFLAAIAFPAAVDESFQERSDEEGEVQS